MRHTLNLALASLILLSGVCRPSLAQAGAASGPVLNPRLIDGVLVYRVMNGSGVSAPRATFAPLPKSDGDPKAKDEGPCILWLIVGTDGRPLDVRVARLSGRGREMDEKAVETVKKWRFEPANKDGHPVAAEINVEVSFR